MNPTVGRIVHFVDRDEFLASKNEQRPARPYAAVVTQVHQPAPPDRAVVKVDIGVFHPELGYQLVHNVQQGTDANCWDWPAREPEPLGRGPSTSARPTGGGNSLAEDQERVRGNEARERGQRDGSQDPPSKQSVPEMQSSGAAGRPETAEEKREREQRARDAEQKNRQSQGQANKKK